MTAAEKTPGQADEIPDAYARYIRAVFPPEVLVSTPNEIAGRWKHMTGPAEREFWRSLDALRAELADTEAERDELRELFDEARIAEPVAVVAPRDSVAPELRAAMAETRQLRELVAEICDTLASQKYPAARLAPWRQRAGIGGAR